MPHELLLEGLDGSNPLGFLAALGVLRVLSEQAEPAETPRLAWRNEGLWRPVIKSVPMITLEGLVARLVDDISDWEVEPLLRFRYPKLEKAGIKLVAGLRPPLPVFRSWVRARLEQGEMRSVAYSSALVSETACEEVKEERVPSEEALAAENVSFDPSGEWNLSLMPTSFDFTSRNAQFLDQLSLIRGVLNARAFEAELEGQPTPVKNPRRMDWDPSANVPGAIQTIESIPAHPACEWLAFRGLVHLPVFGRRDRLDVTGCRGKRKNGLFVWPIWQGSLATDVARALLAYPNLDSLPIDARSLFGIAEVFCARLSKAADGYSGRFEPSSVT